MGVQRINSQSSHQPSPFPLLSLSTIPPLPSGVGPHLTGTLRVGVQMGTVPGESRMSPTFEQRGHAHYSVSPTFTLHG